VVEFCRWQHDRGRFSNSGGASQIRIGGITWFALVGE
jgi:hypothetical protein